MSKTIENNEVQVPNTPEMNDRDIATEILTTEKHLSDAYSVFLNEASNENLFNKILSIFEQTQKNKDLFMN